MMAIDDPTFDTLTAMQLELALARGEFVLYYQQLIDVRNDSVHGVEALIRWNHPQRGLLNPAEFIPLAEETGMIVSIGSWVLRQACADLIRLQAFSPSALLLSVNISAYQLDEPTFLSELADILRRTGVVPGRLQLEITESIFLRDALRIGALFHAIRTLGVKIAFDDFGTGYSSLNYLASYPADLVKIDQYFVQRMSMSYVHTEIVQLIVHLARTIGMSVSAEGVESREQAAALTALGCDIAQGFLYSPPVPLTAMTEMLEQTSFAPVAPRPMSVRSALTALRVRLAQ